MEKLQIDATKWLSNYDRAKDEIERQFWLDQLWSLEQKAHEILTSNMEVVS